MSKWVRVNRKRPCQICRHQDWCGYSADGTVAICMRVDSDHSARNGGWIHRLADPVPYVRPVRQAIPDALLNATGLWKLAFDSTDFHHLDGIGESLGVDTDALKSIGCAWSVTNHAWMFPMKDAKGIVIGIRLRNERGEKWSVKGSRSGLFIPDDYSFAIDQTLYLVEGPTDLAAAMTLGLRAIGRPACLGQENLILEYLRIQKVDRLVIITDNDTPGLRGAEKLQSVLPILSCVYVPPCKDIREFLTLGGSRPMIEATVKDTVWTRPQRVAA